MIIKAIQSNAAEFETILENALSKSKIASFNLYDAVKYSSLGGGKRFRPFLVKEVAALYGVDKDIALEAAVAIELIHCYSLVHDDLPAMDDDDLRRGRLTTHKQYDEATAILVGDILQTMAFEHLSKLNIDTDEIVKLTQILSLGSQDMVSGQMLDMEAENKEANQLKLEDIQAVQQLKTGALIATSAQFGAILGGASQNELENIHTWGLELGEAFQITDDLLDTLGAEEKAGKRLQKDDAHGKVTFVTLLGVDGAKIRVTNLQKSAYKRLLRYEGKADNLNSLWQWLVTRDH